MLNNVSVCYKTILILMQNRSLKFAPFRDVLPLSIIPSVVPTAIHIRPFQGHLRNMSQVS